MPQYIDIVRPIQNRQVVLGLLLHLGQRHCLETIDELMNQGALSSEKKLVNDGVPIATIEHSKVEDGALEKVWVHRKELEEAITAVLLGQGRHRGSLVVVKQFNSGIESRIAVCGTQCTVQLSSRGLEFDLDLECHSCGPHVQAKTKCILTYGI